MKKTKKYLFFIIPIILILAISLIIFWPKFFQNDYKTFSSDDYSFSYPKSWQEMSGVSFDKYNEQVDSGIVKNDSTNTSVGVYIEKVEENKKFNLDKSIEEMDKYHSKRHNSFEKVSSEKIDFLGNEAIDYRFNYSIIKEFRGETQYRTDRQIIFYYYGKIYDIMLSTDPKDFERDNKDFNKIISTFKIK